MLFASKEGANHFDSKDVCFGEVVAKGRDKAVELAVEGKARIDFDYTHVYTGTLLEESISWLRATGTTGRVNHQDAACLHQI
jgi:hypothetical protein